MALPTDIAALLKQLENESNKEIINKLKASICMHLSSSRKPAPPAVLPKADIGGPIVKLDGVRSEM